MDLDDLTKDLVEDDADEWWESQQAEEEAPPEPPKQTPPAETTSPSQKQPRPVVQQPELDPMQQQMANDAILSSFQRDNLPKPPEHIVNAVLKKIKSGKQKELFSKLKNAPAMNFWQSLQLAVERNEFASDVLEDLRNSVKQWHIEQKSQKTDATKMHGEQPATGSMLASLQQQAAQQAMQQAQLQRQQKQQEQQPQKQQGPAKSKKIKTEDEDNLDVLSSTGVNLAREEEQLLSIARSVGQKVSSNIAEGVVDNRGLYNRVADILNEHGMTEKDLTPRNTANLMAPRSTPLPYLAQSLQALLTHALEKFVVASHHRTGLFRKRVRHMNAIALEKGESRVVLDEGQRRDNWSEASVADYLATYENIDRRKEHDVRNRIHSEREARERDAEGGDDETARKKASKMSARQQEMALPDDIKLRNQAKAIEQQLGTGRKYGWMQAQSSGDSLVPVMLPTAPQASRPKVSKAVVPPVLKINVDDALFVIEKDPRWRMGPIVEKWKVWKNWDWVDGGQAFNSAQSTMAQNRKRKAADDE